VSAAKKTTQNATLFEFRGPNVSSSSESGRNSWNEGEFEEGQEVVSGNVQDLDREVDLKYLSKNAGKEMLLSGNTGRMRAAARAKGGHSKVFKRVKRAPTRRFPPIKRLLKQVVKKLANLELNENELQLVPLVNKRIKKQTALVPYSGPFNPLRPKKFRVKVMLEEEDKRVWRLLMDKGTNFEDENSEKNAPRDWEEERATMKARADKFINRMHLVQGMQLSPF
jgi:hypothetical protein